MGERNLGFLEEAFPADALGPFAQPLVLSGVIGVDLEIFLTAATVVGQRGGSLGINGMATLENLGL